MKAGWNASQYLAFAADRARPAIDLLRRIPQHPVLLAMDLGCGPGNSTELLLDQFPEAEIVGVDSDADMLAAARRKQPTVTFVQAQIEHWQPAVRPDLIFANASLQWIAGHTSLFPRLLDMLAPHGVLAIQMPDNLDEPCHRMMQAVAADPQWAVRLAKATRNPLMKPTQYHELLRPLCQRLDLWRTTYYHEMTDLDEIIAWFKGSALRPYLEALEPDERPGFLHCYREAIAPFYPDIGGRVLLPFPRLFIVAQL